MSNGQEDVSSQPLVIVRRRRNTDEEHHGGVWKIAYADFMTAMMAFFLVMWLINAADKKTIVQVAAYFNPMRLTDRVEAPKGLDDLNEIDTRQNSEQNKKGRGKEAHPTQTHDAPKASKDNNGEALDEEARNASAATGGKSAEAQKEDALFDNPGRLLDRLANDAKASQAMMAAGPADGSINDPFDRLNRRAGLAQAAKPTPEFVPANPTALEKAAKPLASPGEATAPQGQNQKQAAQAVNGKDTDPIGQGAGNKIVKSQQASDKQTDRSNEAIEEAKARKLQTDLSNALSKVSSAAPNIEVKATSEGLLVSLLDDANFGMFEVGSAKPRPALVLIMGKMGDVLKSQLGNIVIRGHTDSRAYRNGNYDNWRLSAARAQMAYYMLVRGGIAETRVVAIEGRADRDPKIPSDTQAPQNRRIDILIKNEDRR